MKGASIIHTSFQVQNAYAWQGKEGIDEESATAERLLGFLKYFEVEE